MRAWHLRAATRVLARGGLIAYPTEAVWGLGCLPGSARAVARILALKRRKTGKGLILVASNFTQLRDLIDVSSVDLGPVLRSWPGPVTWILPASRTAPRWVTGGRRSLAVRVSAHPVVRALCDAAGPIVSTSANPAGLAPARTASRVRTYFRRRIDLFVPGAVGAAAGPSEIRDARSGRVLRKGG